MGDTRQRYIAGCMTGTSLDGLDVALTELRGSGLDMTAHFVGMVSLPLGELADQLRHFAEGNAAPPLDFMRAARQLGELHADAVAQLCDEHLPKDAKLDFVVAHGQTIWHAPEAGRKTEKQESRKAENVEGVDARQDAHHRCDAGMSWQLFDPWPIVKRINVPVCYDLRQADLIAGGQGAPITPIADWVMFRHVAESVTIINLGGVLNISELRGSVDCTMGGDVGPCNLLIDGIVQHFKPEMRFDKDGTLAAAGKPIRWLKNAMYWQGKDPKKQTATTQEKNQSRESVKAKSLGREDFSAQWVRRIVRSSSATARPEDWIFAAVDDVAERIGATIAKLAHWGPAVLAGGGVKNPVLLERIRFHADDYCADDHADAVGPPTATILLSDDLGIPCEAREAMGFAVLGALSQDGVPITLPQVTGAKDPGIAGAWAGV